MLRFYLSKKRKIVLFLGLIVMLYSTHKVLSGIDQSIAKYTQPPAYFKKSFVGETNDVNSEDSLALNPTFLPSFFVCPLIKFLTQNNGHHAKLLAKLHGSFSKPNPFSCICGRVSDACICCGSIFIHTEFTTTLPLRTSSPKPIILFAMSDDDPATFCLNITYLPKKEQVRTGGFLVSNSAFTANSSISTNYFSQKRILFENVFLNYKLPSQICVENSRTDPELALCIQFSDLRYFYDTSSDHKMAFTGCAHISILVRRKYIITRYERFCFRAHRDAAGDVDRVAEAHKKFPITPSDNKTTNNILMKQSSLSIATINRIKIPAPMDAQDALRGVP